MALCGGVPSRAEERPSREEFFFSSLPPRMLTMRRRLEYPKGTIQGIFHSVSLYADTPEVKRGSRRYHVTHDNSPFLWNITNSSISACISSPYHFIHSHQVLELEPTSVHGWSKQIEKTAEYPVSSAQEGLCNVSLESSNIFHKVLVG